MAVPRTRGAEPLELIAHASCWPFPAHAGLNRPCHEPSSCGTRPVPRTRGAEPSVRCRTVRCSSVPRTRGAEPLRVSIWTICDRVPRTRGAEPLRGRPSVTLHRPFPAHAGLNRHRRVERSNVNPVPRTRGDEPYVIQRFDLVSAFPAHAGMNRASRRCTRSADRSPHTRG